MKALFVTLFCIISWLNCFCQPPVTSELTDDPGKIKYVFTDLQNFVSMYDKLGTSGDSIQYIRDNYFKKGTIGFQQFTRQYTLKDSALLPAIRKTPLLYDSVRYVEAFIKSNTIYFEKYFRKLKELYPEVVFPPIYFLVGDNRGINSGSPMGVLSEVEAWKKGKELQYISLLVHEVIHFNEARNVGFPKFIEIYGSKASILNYTIREGIAEFFARAVTGRYTQEPAREYVLKHEKELWEEFKRIKDNKDPGEWIFNMPKDKSKPFDIGYVFGALIVEHYYKQANDKKKALNDILNITDYSHFLNQSGYARKFD